MGRFLFMKTILIIGASSGIGKQTALDLSDQGYRVIGTYNKTPPIQTDNIEFHPFAVGEPLNFSAMNLESLDGIAYMPGSIDLKPFHRIDPEWFVTDFRLQVVGAIDVLQQVRPLLLKGNDPSVLLFSTVAVQRGFPFHTLVSSSKGALEGLTKALAAEWAPRIRVNCIAPSLTKTPLSSSILSTSEKEEANAKRHPLNRIGLPEDLAAASAFLLSERSSWISGQVITVDGGITSIKN